MADERIDIVLTDKVDDKIVTKLKAIATHSVGAHNALTELQTQLKQLDMGALNQLATISNNGAAALTRQTKAMNAAAEAARQAAEADALRKARLLEVARTAVEAKQAQDAASAAAMKNASALKPLAAGWQAVSSAQVEAMRQGHAAIRQQAALATAIQDVVTKQDKVSPQTRRTAADFETLGTKAGLARHNLVNLGFQVQDIGVSLASGQNPLTVFIQQGAQIAGIAAQAGVGMGAMAKAAAAMLVPFLPLVALIGAVVGGLKLLSVEWSKTADLEAYAKGLGLTDKEIKKLDADSLTLGDTLKGLWATLNDATGAGDTFSKLADGAIKAFKNIVGAATLAFQSVLAIGKATVDTLIELWRRLPSSIKKPIVDAMNEVIYAFTSALNFIITGTNQIIAGLNKVASVKIDPIELVGTGMIPTDEVAASGKDLADTFLDSYTKQLADNKSATAKFMADWQNNSVDAAKKRIKEGAGDSTGKSAENRAAALAKVNAQLDNELARLGMLAPEREKQQRFDQIEEQMLGKKIKLTSDEVASIKSKIEALYAANEIQKQSDRIYEESTGTQRDYQASLTAAQKLLDKGAITMGDYVREVTKAEEAYQSAIDPLREFKQELEFEGTLYGKSNAEREVAIQLHQLETQLRKQGVQELNGETEALKALIEQRQRESQVQREYEQIQSETGGRLNQIQASVVALNMAYQDGSIGMSMYQANMAKLGAEAARLRISMDQAIPGDFGAAVLGPALQGYQGVMTGIVDSLGSMFVTLEDGIAHSLAGAIMGTENLGEALQNVASQAVEQLLASLIKIGIQYALNAAIGATLGQAAVGQSLAGAAATAIAWAPAAAAVSLATLGTNSVPAVAGIAAANVASMSFASLAAAGGAGFKDGGYTGDMGINQVAGVVHGQEYVMRADTVSRLGVDTMNAIQNGTPLTSSGSTALGATTHKQAGNSRMPNVIVNNNGTPQNYQVESWSEDDIRLIASDVAEQSVIQGAGKAVARDLRNPNSRASKSLSTNTLTKRRR